MKTLLDVVDVTKSFGRIQALKGVSLSLYPGEVFGLLGANGAGKTTLSSIMVSLCPPTSGDVLYKGSSIYKDVVAYRQCIGYCPQSVNLNYNLKLKDNLLFAGRFYGLHGAQLHDRYNEIVNDFGLSFYVNEYPDVLSGGYKQRFLIARALMHKPSLILLDEPTVGLDPHIRRQLWRVIEGLKDRGVTVILTTHYLDEAEHLSDRVCFLDKGNVKLIDTPEGLKKAFKKEKLEDVFLHLMDEEEK